MILYDGQILDWIKGRLLDITPFHKENLQPASYDCTLDDDFLAIDTAKSHVLRLRDNIPYKKLKSENGKIIIPEKSFVLASTVEKITLCPMITGFVEGRSSVGRLGLFVQNAGLIDAGFQGNITLELFNANNVPIELEVGCRICQIVFFEMRHNTKNPYNGKYQNQLGTTGSLVNQDFEYQ